MCAYRRSTDQCAAGKTVRGEKLGGSTTDAAALYIGAASKSDGIPNAICASTTIIAVSTTNGLAADLLESLVKSLEEFRNLEP